MRNLKLCIGLIGLILFLNGCSSNEDIDVSKTSDEKISETESLEETIVENQQNKRLQETIGSVVIDMAYPVVLSTDYELLTGTVFPFSKDKLSLVFGSGDYVADPGRFQYLSDSGHYYREMIIPDELSKSDNIEYTDELDGFSRSVALKRIQEIFETFELDMELMTIQLYTFSSNQLNNLGNEILKDPNYYLANPDFIKTNWSENEGIYVFTGELAINEIPLSHNSVVRFDETGSSRITFEGMISANQIEYIRLRDMIFSVTDRQTEKGLTFDEVYQSFKNYLSMIALNDAKVTQVRLEYIVFANNVDTDPIIEVQPAWVFTIETKGISQPSGEEVTLYQNRAFDALTGELMNH